MRLYPYQEFYKALSTGDKKKAEFYAKALPTNILPKTPSILDANFACDTRRGQVDSKPNTTNKTDIEDCGDILEPAKKKFKGIPTPTFSLTRCGTAENPVDLGDLPGFDPVPPLRDFLNQN